MRKIGLELLIRKKEGGGSYEIRTLDPTQVFLRFRPVRRPGVRIEENAVDEATGTFWVLRIAGGEGYLRIGPRERFVFEEIDGEKTIQDLAAAYFFAFGSFDFEEVRTFLQAARDRGLLELVRPGQLARVRSVLPPGRLARALLRLSRIDLRWEGADAVLRSLHRVLRPLFHPLAIPLHLAAGAAGLGLWLEHRFSDRFGAAELPFLGWLALFLLLSAPVLVLHEASHGLACIAAGRRVKAVGITFLDRLLPVAYVDVTDMWMGSRRGRIGVALAGPLLNLVLLAAASFGALASGDPGLSAFLLVVADVNVAMFLWTAWPFTGMTEDGYDALTDAVRVAALRRRAFLTLRALAGGPPAPPLGEARRAVLAYVAGTALTLAAAASGLVLAALRIDLGL